MVAFSARGERGAAVVWSLALVCVVLMSGLIAAAVGVQAVARQRAATVADLSALAGAQAPDDRCAAAASAARANDAVVVACTLRGPDVIVTVRQQEPAFVGRVLAAFGRGAAYVEATSRAGPP